MASPVADRAEKRKGMNCAECRRSKLKCDRKIPCSSCVKRGCANICPDGMQAATKGMKLIATQEENAQLKARVEALEAALKQLQSHVPAAKHPLLVDLEISNGGHSQDNDSDGSETLDAFGHLTLGEDGSSSFYGRMAQTEYLLEQKEVLTTAATAARARANLPPEVITLSDAFPFGLPVPPDPGVKDLVFSFIPQPEMAWRLYEIYNNRVIWLLEPVAPQEFLDQIYSYVYPADGSIIGATTVHPHRLSVLYMICAIATLLDENVATPLPFAEEWHHLARASLALCSLTDKPTIMGVQTMFLMVLYNFIWDRCGAEKRWVMLGIVTKLMVSNGLHHDPARWKLPPEEIHRRRWSFWNVNVYDIWSSFVFGRPPSLLPSQYDCKLWDEPEDDGDNIAWGWRIKFFSALTSAMQLFGSVQVTYIQILKIDRVIRKLSIPEPYMISGLGSKSSEGQWAKDLVLGMSRFGMLMHREATFLLIHRPYFAQALDDSQPNHEPQISLLQSRYTPSIMAVFRSSCLLIAGLRDLGNKHPEVIRRWWLMWQAPYTAGIVLASLVIRNPQCHLAKAAVPVLDSLIELFERLKPMFGPINATDTLKRLAAAAHSSAEKQQNDPSAPNSGDNLELGLPLLDGRTRLITGTPDTNGPPNVNPSVSYEAAFGEAAFGDVHPSVLEYFNALEGGSPSQTSASGDRDTARSSPSSIPSQAVDESDHWLASQWTSGVPNLGIDTRQTPMQVSGPGSDIRGLVNSAVSPVVPFTSESNGVPGADGAEPMEIVNTFSAEAEITWDRLLNQLGIPSQSLAMQTTVM